MTTEPERRSTADAVFTALRDDIVKMRLRPGTRLSEAEVAKKNDISRQPVREAFIRLDNLRLLQIRPQRATVVRPMSRESISRARLIRLGVELEVVRMAAARCDKQHQKRLQKLLDQQHAKLDAGDVMGFTKLDLLFHAELCILADATYATDVIKDCKDTVDRLCMLALRDEASAHDVFKDHCDLVDRIAAGDTDGAIGVLRQHLCRLDETILDVQREHPDYFEA